MPNVTFVRDDVKAMLPRWNLIRDCISGDKAVKGKKETYLPKPNPSDTSTANDDRFKQYIERAVFYNVTQRTHAGLVGQVFSRDPIAKLSAMLEPLLTDADGAGVPLFQQAKKSLGQVLAYGRCGLLVDYPETGEVASRKELLEGHSKATIVQYDPWDVINWRTRTIGARKMLSLVVIAESCVLEDDGFELKTDQQWRVLRLDKDGIYQVELWRLSEGTHVMYKTFTPKDSKGEPLQYIPFTFTGSVNNDTNVDMPPLYDLASLNIAHYRNSADYEEACFICGQPTPVLAGLTKDWVEDVLKGTVSLGSRAAVPLPAGGTAALLQATANTMPFEAMEHKERQMVALGAKLVEQRDVQRTLGEARIEHASEASVLITSAENVAAAYRQALEWCGVFLGDDSEQEFDLNTDLDIGKMPAPERAQLIAEWQANAISFTEMRFNLKRANIAYLDDEEAKEEIEEDMQTGLKAAAAAMDQFNNPDSDPTKDSEDDK